MSTADANPRSSVPWASAPARTDARVLASGLPWTILRLSAFMQNIAQLASPTRRGFLPQTSGSGAVGWVDTGDVARVAARVLTERDHDGREYVLTGPERLSMADIAGKLSAEVGHRVRYVHVPGPVFHALLRLSGTDGWTAHGLVRQFVDVVREGADGSDELSTGVDDITGAAPTSFTVYARRNRGLFSRS